MQHEGLFILISMPALVVCIDEGNVAGDGKHVSRRQPRK
jgi:hypothetical protein